ncbi:MAG: hypothetical protein WAN48_10280, partial [Actinomycetes bacterium]
MAGTPAFCVYCGAARAVEGAAFCGSCGKPMASQPVEGQAAAAMGSEAPAPAEQPAAWEVHAIVPTVAPSS